VGCADPLEPLLSSLPRSGRQLLPALGLKTVGELAALPVARASTLVPTSGTFAAVERILQEYLESHGTGQQHGTPAPAEPGKGEPSTSSLAVAPMDDDEEAAKERLSDIAKSASDSDTVDKLLSNLRDVPLDDLPVAELVRVQKALLSRVGDITTHLGDR